MADLHNRAEGDLSDPSPSNNTDPTLAINSPLSSDVDCITCGSKMTRKDKESWECPACGRAYTLAEVAARPRAKASGGYRRAFGDPQPSEVKE